MKKKISEDKKAELSEIPGGRPAQVAIIIFLAIALIMLLFLAITKIFNKIPS